MANRSPNAHQSLKTRQNISGGDEKILGYDGAGVVKQVGAKVDAQRFAIGAEVYFAGDLTRNGSNAEFIAVDSRIVGFDVSYFILLFILWICFVFCCC